MKNNAVLTGMMIRKYRLAQNMSQEALCQGICAVSYLSKIEKGSVICSEEILSRLLEVLGISIPDNAEILEPYYHKINDYFHHFFYSNEEECESIMAELRSKADILHHSYLALDMMLAETYEAYRQYSAQSDLPSKCLELLQYQNYMNDIQAYRLFLLLGMYETYITHRYTDGQTYYHLAQNRKRDGIVLAALSASYYVLGNYLESITLGDEAYTLLLKEGNVLWAIDLCFTISAAYANYRDLDKSRYYYNRILALNKLTKDQIERARVYYNIGSSYLVSQDYVQALYHLEQSYELSHHGGLKAGAFLLLLQKLFLTHMALKQQDKAKAYLTLALDFYQTIAPGEINESLKASIGWMEMMFHNKDYLLNEDYLQAIQQVHQASLKDSHHGFHLFYGNYLIEAYKKQRKYKEALKITEVLYVKSHFS